MRAVVAPQEPISPELVLVDPELAEAARRALPAPDFLSRPRTPPEAPVASVDGRRVSPETAPSVARTASPAAVAPSREILSRSDRRRKPLTRALVALTLYVVGPVLVVSAATYAAELAADAPPSLVAPDPTTQPLPTPADPSSRGSGGSAPAAGGERAEPATPGATSTRRSGASPKGAARGSEAPPPARPPNDSERTGVQTRPRTAASPAPRARQASRPKPSGPPTVLVWIAVEGAASYRFELFRGKSRIYSAVTRKPRIELQPSWRYRRVRYRLEPAKYRWVVRPLKQRGAKLVTAPPIVESVWIVTTVPAG